MRLLLVTQDFPPNTGGIETYCYQLAKRFGRELEKLVILAPAHPRAETVDSQLNATVKRIPVKNSLLPLAAPFVLPGLAKKYEPDVALHAQWQTLWSSLWARKRTGYPRRIFVAAHARELLIKPYSGGGWFSDRLHNQRKKLLKKADGFFPVSHYTADLLKKEGIPNKKISVVGNGTDPGYFAPCSTEKLRRELGLEGKKILFSVCRLVPRKGMDLVLQAMSRITKHRKDVVYLLGGSGEDRQRLERLSVELGIEKYVRFMGRIPNERLPTFYSLADVFVMPVRSEPPDVEGFGIVFLEANACETPVIGSCSGGIPDAVVEGETGLLVDEGDVDQLHQAITTLLDNPELAKEMGKNGRKRVLEKATWDQAAKKILEKMQNK